MTDVSGVNIEISEICQIDTSDLNAKPLEDSTCIDVSDNTGSDNEKLDLWVFFQKNIL